MRLKSTKVNKGSHLALLVKTLHLENSISRDVTKGTDTQQKFATTLLVIDSFSRKRDKITVTQCFAMKCIKMQICNSNYCLCPPNINYCLLSECKLRNH